MRLHATGDVEEFAAAAQGFLDTAPASRTMLRSVVVVARRDPHAWSAPPSFWWIDDEQGAVHGCAAWTPPFPLLVTAFPAEMADELLASARERAVALSRTLTHVFGPRPHAECAAQAWTRSTGNGWSVQMAELLHEADVLVEPARPSGAMRQATVDDLDRWLTWAMEFEAESGVIAGGRDEMRAIIERSLREGRGFFWEDPAGAPVSMVGHAPPLPDMARIGPVYTPPALRRRGYARRLTWEVSRLLLETRGLQRCVLYTDVANPVSNSIYRQIGYRPIEEHAVLRLDGG